MRFPPTRSFRRLHFAGVGQPGSPGRTLDRGAARRESLPVAPRSSEENGSVRPACRSCRRFMTAPSPCCSWGDELRAACRRCNQRVTSGTWERSSGWVIGSSDPPRRAVGSCRWAAGVRKRPDKRRPGADNPHSNVSVAVLVFPALGTMSRSTAAADALQRRRPSS